MQYFYAEVPKEYIQSLDRERDSIILPNGNYLANYAFIYQLHCLVSGPYPYPAPLVLTKIHRNAYINPTSRNITGQT